MSERTALRWGLLLAAAWAAVALCVVHPQVVGLYHDDGIYLATAKSLAEGHGYRLINLPGAPAQTKYPPLLPFLLSLLWRAAPAFPSNVVCFKALGILCSAAALALWQRLGVRELGLPPAASLVALAVTIASPRLLASANWVLAEPLVGLLAALALLAASHAGSERRPELRAAGAGALAGLAALAHLQAVALAVALAAAFLIGRRPRAGLIALATAGVPLAAWRVWCALQPAPASPLLAYYVTYGTISPWRHGRGWSTAALDALDRLRELPAAAGALMVGDAPGRLVAGLVLLGGAGWGAVTLARRGRWPVTLAAVAAVALTVAVPWPSGRFLLPWLPLLVALGALAFARASSGVRRAGVLVAAAVLLVGGARLVTAAVQRDRASVPDFHALSSRRGDWPGFEKTARYLAGELPAGARVAAIHDPFYFLYSGHPAVRFSQFRPLGAAILPAGGGGAAGTFADLAALGVSWLVLDPGSVDLERDGPAALALGRAIVALPEARARLVFRSADRGHEVWELGAAAPQPR